MTNHYWPNVWQFITPRPLKVPKLRAICIQSASRPMLPQPLRAPSHCKRSGPYRTASEARRLHTQLSLQLCDSVVECTTRSLCSRFRTSSSNHHNIRLRISSLHFQIEFAKTKFLIFLSVMLDSRCYSTFNFELPKVCKHLFSPAVKAPAFVH